MGKIIKKIFKWLLIAVIVALNVIVWTRIYISSDAEITKKIMLDAQTLEDFKSNPTSYTVREYFPSTTMDELGKVQLRYITHIEQTDDFQFTLKYNIDYFEGKTPLKYVLRCVSDESERVFEDFYTMTQDRYIFRYIRFSLCGIDFDENDSLILDVYTSDGELYSSVTLVSPQISHMVQKTVTLKTIEKE